MKRSVIALLMLLTGGLVAQPSVLFGQQQPQEIPFDSVPNFLKLPAGTYLGEGAGVAVNSKGQIFVYTRNGSSAGHIIGPQAATLLQFGPDGAFIRQVKDLYSMAWAHAVRVDREDNVWLVDNGSDMVVKLSPDLSRVLLVLGRRRESVAAAHPRPPEPPGTPVPPARDTVFDEPTDIAFDPQGNIFISDGYRNQSVAKFDKDGDWVKRIGKGNMGERGDLPGEFNTPHGIAADAKGNIYVADRGNQRVQVFDSDLKFLREIKIDVPAPADATSTVSPPGKQGTFAPGAPWAVCITPGPNQVLYVADSYPGRMYKLSLDGKVLGYFGKNGKQLKQFNWIHSIACPSENEIYVGEILTWRVQKLILKPGKTTTNSQ
ncbi:MAG: 6-bladed beta-propeller [Acidobacteria bacterium]|nr:6-bladed beta-propeller [Acidobacteriota bacterium]